MNKPTSCECQVPRLITQPSGRVICEGCGAGMLTPPPAQKERP